MGRLSSPTHMQTMSCVWLDSMSMRIQRSHTTRRSLRSISLGAMTRSGGLALCSPHAQMSCSADQQVKSLTLGFGK